MNKKYILTAIFLCLLSLNLIAAEGAVSGNDTKPVKKEKVYNYLIAAGGGYFIPLGKQADSLDPSWATRVYFEYNTEGSRFTFLGMDFGYSNPKDKVVDGGIHYITAIPQVALGFSPYSAFDLKFIGGAGFTFLYSVIRDGQDEKNNFSMDFTVKGGTSISKTFAERYMIGAEADIFYLFEKNSSTAFAVYGFAGYRF